MIEPQKVEIVAVVGLTIIALTALIFGKSSDIAAAAVGGIAGFLTHKKLSEVTEENELNKSEESASEDVA